MTAEATPPRHWRRGNIRRFALMKTGHTPSRSVEQYWQNTDIPWFTLADVWQLRDGRQVYLGETANRISGLGLDNSAAELLPKGTVVLSRTASVGFSGIMARPMATSQDFWNWVCGPELLPEFLNYQFKTMQREFKALNMGSTHQTIYQKDAASLQILVPPIDEQRAIVNYLDYETAQIDTLTAKQEQLIATLRERRRAFIDTAVNTGERIELRRIIAELRQGWSPVCEPWPTDGITEWAVLKVGVSNSGTFAPTENKRLPDWEAPRPEFAVRIGEIVMSRSNTKELVGAASVVTRSYPRLLLSDLTYGLTLRPGADPRFVAYVLGSTQLRAEISAVSKGTSPSMQKISQRDVRELTLALPSLDDQRRIVHRLDEQTAKIDALIAKAERFIELSKERRAALITAAVTRQIDVRASA